MYKIKRIQNGILLNMYKYDSITIRSGLWEEHKNERICSADAQDTVPCAEDPRSSDGAFL